MNLLMWILHSFGTGFLGAGAVFAFTGEFRETRREGLYIFIAGVVLCAIWLYLGGIEWALEKFQ